MISDNIENANKATNLLYTKTRRQFIIILMSSGIRIEIPNQ